MNDQFEREKEKVGIGTSRDIVYSYRPGGNSEKGDWGRKVKMGIK